MEITKRYMLTFYPQCTLILICRYTQIQLYHLTVSVIILQHYFGVVIGTQHLFCIFTVSKI